PVCLLVLPETCDSVATVMERLRKEIPDIGDIVYGDKRFSFELKLLTGDNPALAKMIGNASSGFLKCPHCGADFSKPENLWSNEYNEDCFRKSLSAIIDKL